MGARKIVQIAIAECEDEYAAVKKKEAYPDFSLRKTQSRAWNRSAWYLELTMRFFFQHMAFLDEIDYASGHLACHA